MSWGDKGEEYRPDKCEHASDDGCMWCCQRCNTDTHLCGGCGTVANHKEDPCDKECVKVHKLPGPFDNDGLGSKLNRIANEPH